MLKLLLLKENNGVYTVQETIPFLNSISIQDIIQKHALIKGFILITDSINLTININKTANLQISKGNTIILNQTINSGETTIYISESGVFEFELFIETNNSISALNFSVTPNVFVHCDRNMEIKPVIRNTKKYVSTIELVNKNKYIHQIYDTLSGKTVITYIKEREDNTNQTKSSEHTVVIK